MASQDVYRSLHLADGAPLPEIEWSGGPPFDLGMGRLCRQRWAPMGPVEIVVGEVVEVAR